VGILAAASRRLRRVLVPIMDVMQTLPSFVYLIPVLMLFGLGKVPALIATVVYAVTRLIRPTAVGRQQVDPAANGARQSVRGLPLADADPGNAAARPSQHHGRHQSNHDDGARDGGGGVHDRCSRSG